MKKKPEQNVWLSKAEKLRSFGFNVSLSKRKHSPQQKAAVTRLFERHRHFLAPREGINESKFFPVPPSKRKQLSGLIGSKARTPGGFFLQVPKGVKKKDYTVKISKGRLVEKIKGRAEDHIVPLSSREVTDDPVLAFRRAVDRAIKRNKGKKPRQAQLIVNGFQGKRIQSLKSMLYYLENSPRFLEESAELDEEELADTFQIKLIYGKPKKHKRKAVRGRRS